MSSGMPWPGVVLACPERAALADSYSKLTGRPIIHDDSDWVTIASDEDAEAVVPACSGLMPSDLARPGVVLANPPRLWRSQPGDGCGATIALAATRFDLQPEPDSFRVLADPAGHVLCLCL
jgi:hypothetical protein